MLAHTIIFFALPDNALNIGPTASQGGIVAALANLDMAIGRPIVGYFSDHVGRVNMISIATASTCLLSFCIWTRSKSHGVMVTFNLLDGTTSGTFYAVCTKVGQ